MQNKRLVSLITALLLTLTMANAQQLIRASEKYPEHRLYHLIGKLNPPAYHRVKGHPNLYHQEAKGSVDLMDNNTVPDVMLRLDICAHQLIVYNDFQQRIVAMPPELIVGFYMEYMGVETYFRRLKPDVVGFHAHEYVYVQVLSDGIYPLYKYHYKEKEQLTTPDPLYSDVFKSGIRYFYEVENQLERIRMKESFFKKKFPERYPEIKAFISENKIKVKEEKGFTQVMNYLNEQ